MIKHFFAWGAALVIASAAAAQPRLNPPPPAKAGAAVGKAAPAFTLTDIDGKTHNLSDYTGKVVVLEWFNAGCPWSGKKSPRSVHATGRVKNLVSEAKKAQPEIIYLLIDSSANRDKETVIKENKAARDEFGIKQPILIDHDGKVGKAYGAKTTPHMFVIGPDGKLMYAGAFGERQVKKGDKDDNFVINAINKMKAGEPVEPAQTRPWGCGVKYN
ncbi:MAG: redoxin domain-containing protein [Phycisphaerales bacterium]|nr:redoxin domain-containing protein [Phycisphaerales bacterium]